MAVYGKWRRRWREGQINTAIFPPPSFAPQYDLTSSVSSLALHPSLPRVFSCRPRSQIARSPPGLRNPFVRPSVRPAGYRRPLSLGESVRDTMANDGRRMEGGSTGLHHSAVKPSQPANPKIVVFECVGAKSGCSANRYDLNVSAASNSWLTSLACLLVVAAAAAAVLRRVVPF